MDAEHDSHQGDSQQDAAADKKEQPTYVWLFSIVLKFWVFVIFVFVILAATSGLGTRDLTSQRVWVIIGGMAALLLLLAIDRLTSLKVGPGGMEATLAEAKTEALKEIAALPDRKVVEAAQAKILRAGSPAEVRGALEMAVGLNVIRVVERVKDAIQRKRKMTVQYQADPEGPLESYFIAPLDVKPGDRPATRTKDYLWAYSYKHARVISLRLERVLEAEVSKESFDPAELMAEWKKAPEWNLPRDWS